MIAIMVAVAVRIQAPPAEELAARRARTREALAADAAVVLPASNYTESFEASDDFLYLCGYAERDNVLVLTREAEVLFLPTYEPERVVWEGEYLSRGPEATRRTGVSDTRQTSDLISYLGSLDGIHLVHGPDHLPQDVRAWVAERPVQPVTLVTALLRAVKSPWEIERLRRAVDATAEAFEPLARRIRPGVTERELQAEIEYRFMLGGAEGTSFPSIIASGPNSTVLHYRAGTRVCADGEVVETDVGAQFEGYAADVTRTWPVNGRFDDRQRQVYETVLRAQDAGIAAAQPGATLWDVHRAAAAVVGQGLVDLGLVADAGDYRRYFMHFTCHWLGLDVHDPGPRDARLAPGMAFTIEPGIYVPEWGFGVRIEDDFLVTESGIEHLSAKVPRRVEDVEFVMAGGPMDPAGDLARILDVLPENVQEVGFTDPRALEAWQSLGGRAAIEEWRAEQGGFWDLREMEVGPMAIVRHLDGHAGQVVVGEDALRYRAGILGEVREVSHASRGAWIRYDNCSVGVGRGLTAVFEGVADDARAVWHGDAASLANRLDLRALVASTGPFLEWRYRASAADSPEAFRLLVTTVSGDARRVEIVIRYRSVEAREAADPYTVVGDWMLDPEQAAIEVQGATRTYVWRWGPGSPVPLAAWQVCRNNMRQLYIAMRAVSVDTTPPGWPWGTNLDSLGLTVGTGRAWTHAAFDAGEITDERMWVCPAAGRETYLGPIVDPGTLAQDDPLLVCPAENHRGVAIVVTLGGDTRRMTVEELALLNWRAKVGE